MQKFLKLLTAAGALALAAAATAAPASAQGYGYGRDGYVRVQSGERFERRDGRRDREVVVQRDRRIDRGPIVIERRVGPPRQRVRTVCTTQVRERVTPRGVVIRRPVEVCRQVVVGRGYGPRY